MKKLLLAIFLFSICTTAAFADWAVTDEVCFGYNGEKVQVTTQFNLLRDEGTPAYAAVVPNSETSVIVFDFDIVDGTMDPLALRFIFYHECAHHQLGHNHLEKFTKLYEALPNNATDEEIYTRLEGITKAERAADCRAAKQFVKTYGIKEFERIMNYMRPLHGDNRQTNLLVCGRSKD